MDIRHVTSCNLPVAAPGMEGINTRAFTLHVFQDRKFWTLPRFLSGTPKTEYVALVYGVPTEKALVRIHSECLTGDVFGAMNCDCGRQLRFALSEITRAGAGIVLYMRGQEGRGNGLANKIRTLNLNDTAGLDTVDAHKALRLPIEKRNFDAAVHILKFYFKLNEITLLTNNPLKIKPFEKAGMQVHRRACWVAESKYDQKYLNAKVEKMDHIESGRTKTLYDSGPVLFWPAEHPFANFHAAAIELEGRRYPTVEHYYQAQKFVGHPRIYEEVATASDAMTAKSLSRSYQTHVRSDWKAVREEVMYVAASAKFLQHSGLREILLKTEDRKLIEDSPDDAFWGVTPDRGGLNKMGLILMRVRTELREKRPPIW